MFPLTSKQALETELELEQFLGSLESRGMGSEGVEMVGSYIKSCWGKGVGVVLDPGLQGAYGTYNTDTNTLTLGDSALDCNIELIETLEHEFIHVLQDQMAGIENSSTSSLGLPTTDYAEQMVEASYSHLSEETQALELEAFSFEDVTENPEDLLDMGGLLG